VASIHDGAKSFRAAAATTGRCEGIFMPSFILIHEYGSYALILMAIAHIAAVVLTEVRGGGNLVSAMFTGKKTLRAPLADQDPGATS
jgi:cytochrome b